MQPKKTFDINTVFSNNKGKCLEEILEEVVATSEVDQQDIIDIITQTGRMFRTTRDFFGRREQLLDPSVSRRSMFFNPYLSPQSSFGGYGSVLPPSTVSSENNPEFFDVLFKHVDFKVTYNAIALFDKFKFHGAGANKTITYLGRDKEVCEVGGVAYYNNNAISIILDDLEGFSSIHLLANPDSMAEVLKIIGTEELPLPGTTPISNSLRALQDHIRNQTWVNLTPGELVVPFDNPETVYMLGHRNDDENHGDSPSVSLIPVEVSTVDGVLTAVPNMVNICTMDLMSLMPYKHKG